MNPFETISTFGVATLLAAMLPVEARADLNMQPGLWESATMVGGTTMSTEKKCYLQKDIKALERFQQGESPPGAPCKATGYKATGNTARYTLTCETEGRKTVSSVTMSYEGTVIRGSIETEGSPASTVVNSRIGDCSQSSFGN